MEPMEHYKCILPLFFSNDTKIVVNPWTWISEQQNYLSNVYVGFSWLYKIFQDSLVIIIQLPLHLVTRPMLILRSALASHVTTHNRCVIIMNGETPWQIGNLAEHLRHPRNYEDYVGASAVRKQVWRGSIMWPVELCGVLNILCVGGS